MPFKSATALGSREPTSVSQPLSGPEVVPMSQDLVI
jgi:hypothetical protein